GEGPKREQDTGGENEAVRGDFFAVGAGLLHEAEHLEPEDRENAGHEVQDQTSEKGEGDDADERGRLGHRAAVVAGGGGRAAVRGGSGGRVLNRDFEPVGGAFGE